MTKVAVKGDYLTRAEIFMHKKFASRQLKRSGFKEWFVLPQDSIDGICSLADGDLDNHPDLPPLKPKPQPTWRESLEKEQTDSRTMSTDV